MHVTSGKPFATRSATTNGHYAFRAISPSDVPELHHLDEVCFDKERSFTKSYFQLLFMFERAFGWAAEKNGKLAAFILLTLRRSSANISTIDVHPKHRRQGLGSQLMRMSEKDLLKRGINRCTLQVAVSNHGAIKLYLKLGYKKVRVLKRYYGGREDGYLMEKKLAGY